MKRGLVGVLVLGLAVAPAFALTPVGLEAVPIDADLRPSAGPPIFLFDEFDDGVLDPAWALSFASNATGWTFAESGTNLNVTDIATMTSYCNDLCVGWGYARIVRSFGAIGDFHVDFDFSWSSSQMGAQSDFDAIQQLGIFLTRADQSPFAWASYVDAWGPNGNVLARQSATIGGAVYEGPNILPLAGGASIDIDRVGSTIAVRWNGEILLAAPSTDMLAGVRVEFGYFDERGQSLGGQTCAGQGTCNLPSNHPPSTFGSFSVDRVRVEQPGVLPLRFVDQSATGMNNGLSWADAYTRLQDALADAAGSGGTVTEIWVADGTYKPDQGLGITPGDRTATFQLLNGVAIYGGFAGNEENVSERDIALNVTVLCGDLVGNDGPNFANYDDNSYHVVTGSGVIGTAVLDGFTVSSGNANGANPSDYGGGIFCSAGSPTVRRCTLHLNLASYGGGMFNTTSSIPTIVSCSFAGNLATVSGGGLYNELASSPLLTNCVFAGNRAMGGGGLVNVNGSNPTITDCTFTGNFAPLAGAMANSGDSSPTIINSTFSGNSAGADGGGIFNALAGVNSPILQNCVLWGNSDSGGMDETAQVYSESGAPVISYSIVQGGWTGAGSNNLNTDPKFIDPDGADNAVGTLDDDLRPAQGSPAIDSGNNGAIPSDMLDLDGDMNVIEPLPTDLSGGVRFVDDLGKVDTGVGTPPIVDMGAYEYQGNVVFVDASLAPMGDGLSWGTAFRRLQDALSYAGMHSEITEIWVADGTYRPDQGMGITPGDRTATFQLRNGLALYGGFVGGESSLAQRNPALNVCTLSGDLNGDDQPNFANRDDNSCQVVTAAALDSTGRLDGFTIRGGNAGTLASPPVSTCPTPGLGGGMVVFTASPTVQRCQFTENIAVQGGAMHIRFSAHPVISDCVFMGNRAFDTDAPGGTGGAAFVAVMSNPIFDRCLFDNNMAAPGGTNPSGGAIFVGGSCAPKMRSCIFANNVADGSGGAIVAGGVPTTLLECTFVSNSATQFDGGAAALGFAEVVPMPVASSTVMINCAFLGNQAGTNGGGISNTGSVGELTNCRFSGNVAAGSGGAIHQSGTGTALQLRDSTLVGNSTGTLSAGVENSNQAMLSIANSIFWGNTNSGGQSEGAQVESSGPSPVNYCDIQGWTGANPNLIGLGNFGSDPQFVDADGPDDVAGTLDDDLRLSAGSPAIDAGDSTAVPMDTLDLDGDGNLTERLPLDVGGRARFFDDPLVADTGVAAPPYPVVDMGAYEFFADCNNNGVPDACDLSCGAANGPCDVPGCGTELDCTGNGTPDSCDIAGCPGGMPSCADCNLNGVPDGCDILNCIGSPSCMDINPMTGMPPGDGVPDGCANFAQGCANNLWSCENNWNLNTGDDYPDNDMATTYDVTLDAESTIDDVLLNVSVTIDSLILRADPMTPVVDQPLLRVTEMGQADLTIVTEAGLLNEGTILVANDRVISVPNGPVVLHRKSFASSNRARYAKDPMAVGVSAALNCQSLRVRPGGELVLEDAMSLTVAGDLTLDDVRDDGLQAIPCTQDGGATWPRVRRTGFSMSNIMGGLFLDEHVEFRDDSLIPIQIGGDMANASMGPDCFDCEQGGMMLNGVGLQVFEAAGEDLGATPMGFAHPNGHTNFSTGSLEVAGGVGHSVQFRNGFHNIVGTGPCSEALYVHELKLHNGASIVLDNARVYYETLTLIPTSASVSITAQGCGELVKYCGTAADCAVDPVNNGCNVVTCLAGRCTYACTRYGDVTGDAMQLVNLDDILRVLAGFSGGFMAAPNADINPCGGNGVINVDDILAVLNAFSGGNPCGCNQTGAAPRCESVGQ